MSDKLSEFDNFTLDESDSPDVEEDIKEYVDSSFSIRCDTREQMPYRFDEIIGDYRDEYKYIRVKTIRKKVLFGDYAIEGVPGIAVERKSKSDIFSSLSNTLKRENFIGRLHNMNTNLKHGAIVIECYPREIYEDPPVHTILNPKTIFRTSLSWSQQFPNVSWHWCRDRADAEQTVYRIFEKFYQHEVELRYVHHNKPIDSNIEAFRAGIIARMISNSGEMPYCDGNPLRVSWLRGWGFAESHFKGGAKGTLSEPLPVKKNRKPKKDELGPSNHKPLPGQTSFLEPEEDSMLIRDVEAMGSTVDSILGTIGKKKTSKKRYR